MDAKVVIWFVGAAVLPAAVVAWAVAFVVRRNAPSWGLVDRPDERKSHEMPTPLGGGLAIWAGVVSPLAAGQAALWALAAGPAKELVPSLPPLVQAHLPGLVQQSAALWVLLAAATALMVLGLIDDRRSIDWRIRLLVQFVIAATVVYLQDWRLTAFIDWPVLTGVLSVLWIVGLINAFNMLDNMDGLSAGVAAIAAATLAAVVLLAADPESNGPQWFVGGFFLILVGALAGFLWHNRPPARLFMGDGGSYFVGFCIAVAALLATFSGRGGPAPHAIFAPLCAVAVPLYDAVTVVWIRLREGRSPFQADQCHFSHRLVELGFSKGQAVSIIYLTTAACCLGALLLHRVDAVGAGIIMLLIGCVLALIAVIESIARARVKKVKSEE